SHEPPCERGLGDVISGVVKQVEGDALALLFVEPDLFVGRDAGGETVDVHSQPSARHEYAGGDLCGFETEIGVGERKRNWLLLEQAGDFVREQCGKLRIVRQPVYDLIGNEVDPVGQG